MVASDVVWAKLKALREGADLAANFLRPPRSTARPVVNAAHLRDQRDVREDRGVNTPPPKGGGFGCRVGEDVSILTPHGPGRADF
jgi:hypothetical protein